MTLDVRVGCGGWIRESAIILGVLMARMARVEPGELYEGAHLSAKEFWGKDASDWRSESSCPKRSKAI